MKALVVSQYFWPEDFQINDVANSLLRKHIDVCVLTGKPNYPSGKVFDGYRATGTGHEVHQGLDIYRLPIIPRGRGALRLVANYLSFVISGLLFAPWLLRGKKFDAIFIYAPSPLLQAIPAILLGRIKRCPVILWVQDLWPDSLTATEHIKNKTALNLVALIVRFIYRHSDLLLVQSRAFVKPVTALAGETPVLYFPNSVSEVFSMPPTKAAPDIPGLDGGFTVVFAGNIGSAQAVEVIVDAATILKEHEEIRFVMLGDGSRRDWMLQEVKRRQLRNLYLPGRFPMETMPAVLQKASVLLVTLANREIFAATVPNKIQAYMAVGRPILACLNGEGARLVMEAEAGLAVPAENASDLAEAVLKLYALSIDERETMGENGHKYFLQHFDHGKLIDQLIEYMKSAREGENSFK